MTVRQSSSSPRVIVALDMESLRAAEQFAARVRPEICRLKVGFELFTAGGPAVVEKFVDRGFDVFLDLKFHDIPNTVGKACAAAARLGVWMVNVHTLGGPAMMTAARESISRESHQPLLIGVTILTSHSSQDLEAVGVHNNIDAEVFRLASLARECQLDGVVCSAREARSLRRELGADFCLVTPGIRPAGSNSDDQVRVVSPADARQAGSDYLVIGRPITRAEDPAAEIARINKDLQDFP